MPGRFGHACPYRLEYPKTLASIRYKETLLAHGDAARLVILYRLILKGDNVARDVPLRKITYDVYNPKDYDIVRKLTHLNKMIKQSNQINWERLANVRR